MLRSPRWPSPRWEESVLARQYFIQWANICQLTRENMVQPRQYILTLGEGRTRRKITTGRALRIHYNHKLRILCFLFIGLYMEFEIQISLDLFDSSVPPTQSAYFCQYWPWFLLITWDLWERLLPEIGNMGSLEISTGGRYGDFVIADNNADSLHNYCANYKPLGKTAIFQYLHKIILSDIW